MEAIKHTLTIKAPADKVYKALTTQEGLSGWWAKQTVAQPETGFVNTFTFGTTVNEMKVTRLDAGKRVEWLCIKASEDWVDTIVSFDLEAQDGKTTLRFVHSNWRHANDFFAVCTYHWGLFMTSLKAYCETGTGTPS